MSGLMDAAVRSVITIRDGFWTSAFTDNIMTTKGRAMRIMTFWFGVLFVMSSSALYGQDLAGDWQGTRRSRKS
jgi:hypothetical protein